MVITVTVVDSETVLLVTVCKCVYCSFLLLFFYFSPSVLHSLRIKVYTIIILEITAFLGGMLKILFKSGALNRQHVQTRVGPIF